MTANNVIRTNVGYNAACSLPLMRQGSLSLSLSSSLEVLDLVGKGEKRKKGREKERKMKTLWISEQR